MTPWKMMLGLGVACAACCAIPLLGAAGGLAALASALWACAGEFIPTAIVLGAAATLLASLWIWKQRRAARSSACGCATSRSPGAENVDG